MLKPVKVTVCCAPAGSRRSCRASRRLAGAGVDRQRDRHVELLEVARVLDGRENARSLVTFTVFALFGWRGEALRRHARCRAVAVLAARRPAGRRAAEALRQEDAERARAHELGFVRVESGMTTPVIAPRRQLLARRDPVELVPDDVARDEKLRLVVEGRSGGRDVLRRAVCETASPSRRALRPESSESTRYWWMARSGPGARICCAWSYACCSCARTSAGSSPGRRPSDPTS